LPPYQLITIWQEQIQKNEFINLIAKIVAH